jgi:hypothetical protein
VRADVCQTRSVPQTPIASLAHHARISPPLKDDVLITASVDPEGEAVTLWGPVSLKHRSRSPIRPPFEATGAFMPDTASRRARVVTSTLDGHTDTVEIEGPFPRFPHLHSMPGGEFLLVGYRCWFRDGVAEQNAVVIGPEGTHRRSGALGDGIQDIQITPSGRIIVGYFDEGVFGGNYGWAGAQGGMPIGVSGLVEFDTELDRVWSYPPSWKKSASGDGPVLPPIADAYTLNVVDETVWACIYMDFPVLKVHDGQIRVWKNDLVNGAHDLLVHEEFVGWVGGYRIEPERLTVARLADGDTELHRTFQVAGKDAVAPRTYIASCNRGSKLHRFTEAGDWYILDLAGLSL